MILISSRNARRTRGAPAFLRRRRAPTARRVRVPTIAAGLARCRPQSTSRREAQALSRKFSPWSGDHGTTVSGSLAASARRAELRCSLRGRGSPKGKPLYNRVNLFSISKNNNLNVYLASVRQGFESTTRLDVCHRPAPFRAVVRSR
jgi:hypothetical protein